jgi:hypothetical protein
MKRIQIKLLTTALLAGLGVGAGDAVKADDGQAAGVVRISDTSSPSPTPAPNTNPPATPQQTAGEQPGTAFYQPAYPRHFKLPPGIQRRRDLRNLGLVSEMVATFPLRKAFEAIGGPKVGKGGPLSIMGNRHDGRATYPPDYGWSRPVNYPIRRTPIEYTKHTPDHWYGQPRSANAANVRRYPTVYTPTDTTQLGYYYTRVPTWQPDPSMIPPPPWPSDYVAREKPFGIEPEVYNMSPLQYQMRVLEHNQYGTPMPKSRVHRPTYTGDGVAPNPIPLPRRRIPFGSRTTGPIYYTPSASPTPQPSPAPTPVPAPAPADTEKNVADARGS